MSRNFGISADAGDSSEAQAFNQAKWLRNVAMEDRLNFVRKVYSILTAQLILTVVISLPIMRASLRWRVEHDYLLTVSWIVSFMTIMSTACCRSIVRKFPQNYIILFTFTFFEGIIVGFL